MGRGIDYFFTLQSTWAYIGHEAFLELAAKHDLDVVYRPCWLGEVFRETGGLPLNERHPARQRYRLVEMQRWRAYRGIELNLTPPHFPWDPRTADRMAISLIETGQDPNPFMRAVFRAVWVEDRDPGDDQVLIALANAAGHDGAALLAAARMDAIDAIYRRNTEDGVGLQIIGSPAYVLDGEVFWGQDRLDLLDWTLETGRAPFTADA